VSKKELQLLCVAVILACAGVWLITAFDGVLDALGVGLLIWSNNIDQTKLEG